MTSKQNHRFESLPMANYSSAIARAVEWLGDRYLLAKPIKFGSNRATPVVGPSTPSLRR